MNRTFRIELNSLYNEKIISKFCMVKSIFTMKNCLSIYNFHWIILYIINTAFLHISKSEFVQSNRWKIRKLVPHSNKLLFMIIFSWLEWYIINYEFLLHQLPSTNSEIYRGRSAFKKSFTLVFELLLIMI